MPVMRAIILLSLSSFGTAYHKGFMRPIRNFLAILTLISPAATASPEFGLPGRAALEPAVVELGRKLFFDRRLSINNTLSCAMCHIPEQGFAQNQLATPVGLEGRVVKRNSPTILNVAYQKTLFHDGREFSLVNQVWSPLLSHREMGNLTVGMVIRKIQALDSYDEDFQSTLGEIDAVTIGEALAAFQDSLRAGDSDFDRWFFGGREDAVSASVKQGFDHFRSKGCASCHQIGTSGALFTDHRFHNTGVGYERSMNVKPGQRTIKLTDTITIQTEETFEGEVLNDLGRYEVTGKPADRWRYRTAGLRNIALTAPYMHDGSLTNLEDVVRFYAKGGVQNPGLDPLIEPFEISDRELEELLAFLQSLTSNHIDELIAAARR